VLPFQVSANSLNNFPGFVWQVRDAIAQTLTGLTSYAKLYLRGVFP